MTKFNPDYVRKTEWTEEEIEDYYDAIPQKSFRCNGVPFASYIDVVIDLWDTFDIVSIDEGGWCVYDDHVEPEHLDQLRMWKLGAF